MVVCIIDARPVNTSGAISADTEATVLFAVHSDAISRHHHGCGRAIAGSDQFRWPAVQAAGGRSPVLHSAGIVLAIAGSLGRPVDS